MYNNRIRASYCLHNHVCDMYKQTVHQSLTKLGKRAWIQHKLQIRDGNRLGLDLVKHVQGGNGSVINVYSFLKTKNFPLWISVYSGSTISNVHTIGPLGHWSSQTSNSNGMSKFI